MTEVIDVLATIGQDAALQTPSALEKFVEQSELSAELQESLITGDTITIKRQLDVCPDIVCVILAPEDDEPSEEPEEEEQPEARAAANG